MKTRLDKIDVTCLKAKSRSFLDGLTTPGDGSFTINADARYASHLLLKKLADGKTADKKEPIMWAVGWSDGEAEPTLNGSNTGWVLPTTRTWIHSWHRCLHSRSTSPETLLLLPTAPLTAAVIPSGRQKLALHLYWPTDYTVTVTDALAFVLRIGATATAFYCV